MVYGCGGGEGWLVVWWVVGARCWRWCVCVGSWGLEVYLCLTYAYAHLCQTFKLRNTHGAVGPPVADGGGHGDLTEDGHQPPVVGQGQAVDPVPPVGSSNKYKHLNNTEFDQLCDQLCDRLGESQDRRDHVDHTNHPDGGDGTDPSGGVDRPGVGGQAHVDAVRRPAAALVLVQEPPVGKNGKVRA